MSLKPVSITTGSNFTIESEMSWSDAVTNCQEKNSVLVEIPDNTTNEEIRDLLPNDTEVWIGLSKSIYWSRTSSRGLSQPNWGEGQPDNFYNYENCAAMMLENGMWTDEKCTNLYPFISLYKISYFCLD
uniref:C-type lectin domain-containing protein n=1 Tax=Kryptolebias marmoratus TaxID=37003 RepID=A0A3Q3BMG5_KRYMA